jgi:hypothetical protein
MPRASPKSRRQLVTSRIRAIEHDRNFCAEWRILDAKLKLVGTIKVAPSISPIRGLRLAQLHCERRLVRHLRAGGGMV